MFGLLPLLCVFLSYLTRVYADVRATGYIGNQSAGKAVNFVSQIANATFFGVRWDDDVVRGLAIKLSDGTGSEVGDYNNDHYKLATFNFKPDETLVTAYLRDSGYGYGSLRQIQFTTSEGRNFFAGPSGFDNEVSLNVNGSRLCGFEAWLNSDNFINALLFDINGPPPPPPLSFQWFETPSLGNQAAAKTQVQMDSTTSIARYLAVRWDGDKILGVNITLHNDTTVSAGGIGDVDRAFTSYEFSDGETLTSVSFTGSGYGGESIRQISFNTSLGGSFTAGPDGYNEIIQLDLTGAKLVGFHAWVNEDNFINAFALRATKEA